MPWPGSLRQPPSHPVPARWPPLPPTPGPLSRRLVPRRPLLQVRRCDLRATDRRRDRVGAGRRGKTTHALFWARAAAPVFPCPRPLQLKASCSPPTPPLLVTLVISFQAGMKAKVCLETSSQCPCCLPGRGDPLTSQPTPRPPFLPKWGRGGAGFCRRTPGLSAIPVPEVTGQHQHSPI